MSDREACILLNLTGGIGSVRLKKICDTLKIRPGDIFSLKGSELARVQGIGAALAKKITEINKYADIDYEYDLTERAGVKIVTLYDEEYPTPLKEIYDPPLCLYIRGILPCKWERSIAIVGSRRITHYGRRMAEFIAESAAYAGWTVISGLAYGIDSVAHKAVLNVGGTTLAVLGGGLMKIHPQDHVPLARDITHKGAVISEFPMEFSPNKRTFPMRNRIISGLSSGVIVVEAGLNSGSLITANFALEQGRHIFAVPGEVDNPQAKGCNSLIKQGAKLTESFEDVLEEFEFLPGMSPALAARSFSADIRPDEEDTISDNLSPKEQDVIKLLSNTESLSIDNIAASLSLPIGSLLSVLMELEIKGIVRELPGNRYKLEL